MTRYAIFEDATSTSYGPTDNRRIVRILNVDSSLLSANTPAGYESLLVSDDVSFDTHRIVWTGAAWDVYPRLPPWGAGVWNASLKLNGTTVSSTPTITGDPALPGARYALTSGVWTADASSLFTFYQVPAGTTVKVSTLTNAQYLQETDTVYSTTSTADISFTTELGYWYPSFNATDETVYSFDVDDLRYLPFNLTVRAY